MAGGLPEILTGDMRGIEQFVIVSIMLILPVVFDEPPEERPLGLPEDQARADLVLGGEQLHLFAQPSVIAFFGLFQGGEVFFQVLLVKEGGPVDALQDIPFFIAPPVGAGDPEEFKGLDKAGVRQMGTAAEIGEAPLSIERDGLRGQIPDQLNLVFFPLGCKGLNGGGT